MLIYCGKLTDTFDDDVKSSSCYLQMEIASNGAKSKNGLNSSPVTGVFPNDSPWGRMGLT